MMDLNKQAEEIVDWCRASDGDGYRESWKEAEEYVAAALARVQADERERCAQVADVAERSDADNYGDTNRRFRRFVAMRIARDIRALNNAQGEQG